MKDDPGRIRGDERHRAVGAGDRVAAADGAPAGEAPDASATVDYRVRFDECAPSGAVRAAVYLRWAQDVAWIHSERLGFDRAWYDARELAWVVRGVQLVVLAPSGSGDVLSVSTRVTGYRRVWARRLTEVRTGDARLVAAAFTDWVITDRRGLPTRVPAEFGDRFAVPPGTFEPTRIHLAAPPADAALLPFRVRTQELDPYGHANNAVYVDWLDEAAEASASGGIADGALGAALGPLDAAPGATSATAVPRRYRLEYLLPTPPAAELVACAWPDGRGISYLLRDLAGRDHLRGRFEPGERELVEAREAGPLR